MYSSAMFSVASLIVVHATWTWPWLRNWQRFHRPYAYVSTLVEYRSLLLVYILSFLRTSYSSRVSLALLIVDGRLDVLLEPGVSELFTEHFDRTPSVLTKLWDIRRFFCGHKNCLCREQRRSSGSRGGQLKSRDQRIRTSEAKPYETSNQVDI